MDEVFLAGTEPTATAEPPPPDDAGAPDGAPPVAPRDAVAKIESF